MPEIGSSKLAGGLVGNLKAAVAKAMDEVRLEIAGATTELVQEIKGGHAVARAIRSEAMAVRAEWADVLGNAEAAGAEARQEAEEMARPNGGGAG